MSLVNLGGEVQRVCEEMCCVELQEGFEKNLMANNRSSLGEHLAAENRKGLKEACRRTGKEEGVERKFGGGKRGVPERNKISMLGLSSHHLIGERHRGPLDWSHSPAAI